MPARAAAPRFEILGVGQTRLPVAIAALRGDDAGPEAIGAIVMADLARGGVIRPVPMDGTVAPIANVQREWHGVLAGEVVSEAGARIEVSWTLTDPLHDVVLLRQRARAAAADRRLLAHRIADDIERVLTGVRGAHATRIAYVVQDGPRHLLKVADADGHQHRVVLASPQALISPAWSPDGEELAYVSFEAGQAQVWAQQLATGRRRVLAAWRGSNSAPAWSPDGKRLAVALSRDGLTQIFVLDRQGGSPTRVTRSPAIDTEPTWSADGQRLFFVSDRSGTPQIYSVRIDGTDTQRVTFGGHCVSPATSPDGHHLAYVARQQGALRVVLKDLRDGRERTLSDAADDERPTFSPNGRLLAWATRRGHRDLLVTSSLDGATRSQLTSSTLDMREPAWGPWIPGTHAIA
jgi:TolB protein